MNLKLGKMPSLDPRFPEADPAFSCIAKMAGAAHSVVAVWLYYNIFIKSTTWRSIMQMLDSRRQCFYRFVSLQLVTQIAAHRYVSIFVLS